MRVRVSLLLTVVVAMVLAMLAMTVADLVSGKPQTDGGIPNDMALVPGGTFSMGLEGSNPDEGPVHGVTLKPFLIDRHEVTNKGFAAFVDATGYVTQAKRDGYAWCFLKDTDDFQAVTGANWRHPQGPGSSIKDRMDHPVVCVSWGDATADARWAGRRLPTEAEWEYAARAGGAQHFKATVSRSQTSGVHLTELQVHHHPHDADTQDQSPSSKSHTAAFSHPPQPATANVTYIQANIWQGRWPTDNQLLDGFYYMAPVGQFAPNDWGLYDMIGNVWEWTADWYSSDYYQHSSVENPTGPEIGDKRVARGGSWFCSPNYCGAYSTDFRGASPPTHAFNNVGFRCAAEVPDVSAQ